MRKRPSFKEIVQLLLVVLLGWGFALWLQSRVPIGTDIGSNQIAQQIIADREAPSHDPVAATLTMAVFTDYQCPACRAAHPDMESAIEKDGHVRVIYKDWPIFGLRSERAARVAIASDRQGIYGALHGAMMAERRPLNDAVLQELVEAAGGSWARVQADLQKFAPEIERQLNENQYQAFGLGLAGTPAYLVGSILVVGALDEEEFTEVFAHAREAAE